MPSEEEEVVLMQRNPQVVALDAIIPPVVDDALVHCIGKVDGKRLRVRRAGSDLLIELVFGQ